MLFKKCIMILKVSTAYKNIIAYKYNVRVWPNVEFFFFNWNVNLPIFIYFIQHLML